jgi:23S rRNA pseudouridine1911/1915/1917 synthase
MKRSYPASLVEAIRAFPRQALHARKLRLQHPGRLIAVEYRAPLPEDFEQLLTALEQCSQ